MSVDFLRTGLNKIEIFLKFYKIKTAMSQLTTLNIFQAFSSRFQNSFPTHKEILMTVLEQYKGTYLLRKSYKNDTVFEVLDLIFFPEENTNCNQNHFYRVLSIEELFDLMNRYGHDQDSVKEQMDISVSISEWIEDYESHPGGSAYLSETENFIHVKDKLFYIYRSSNRWSEGCGEISEENSAEDSENEDSENEDSKVEDSKVEDSKVEDSGNEEGLSPEEIEDRKYNYAYLDETLSELRRLCKTYGIKFKKSQTKRELVKLLRKFDDDENMSESEDV